MRFLWLLCLCVFVSCASVKDQIDARKVLADAKFSIKDITIETIDFAGTLFKPSVKNLTLAVEVGIQNDSNHALIMDAYTLLIALDDAHFADVQHDEDTHVAAKSQGSTKLLVKPHAFLLRKIFDTKVIHVRGEARVIVSLIDGVLSLPVTAPIEESIQTDQLLALLRKKMRETLTPSL